ncbi:ABC transporter ATP-binding protein [Hymenobacter sp. HD11105]
MAEVAISIRDLSKLYRLGTTGSGSLRQDLQRWWTTSIRRKDDPFFQVPAAAGSAIATGQTLWALRDINWEVKQGEVWGVIGSNGAGKSTLLKIISRIIRPTRGRVRGRGRISSLLEVGTGFHPELSGWENIFLSGYILGMSKAEIRSRFDEIVDFAGLAPFLDTPVKRYSSGMYVRLAFAVAVHLEPDILILDEVLAVGDAEFQKKSLAKIRDVSRHAGRTVLFVSHSLHAVTQLCQQALWLDHGQVRESGAVSQVANHYAAAAQHNSTKHSWATPAEAPGTAEVRFKEVELLPQLLTPGAPLDIRSALTVRFEFWNLADTAVLSAGLHLYSYTGECICDIPSPAVTCAPGVVAGECIIPGNFLNDGSYYISLVIVRDTAVELFCYEECLSFTLEDFRGEIQWYGKWMGAVRPLFPFQLRPQELVCAPNTL